MYTKIIITLLLAATAAGAAAQDYRIENNEVKLQKTIVFKAGSDQLDDPGREALNVVKKLLAEKSYISLLRIEGHMDNTGDAVKNQQLTEKRAMAVCRELVASGVDCKRLLPVGFGSSKPVAVNTSPEGRAQNRRITLVIAALRGRLIGGMPADGGGRVAGDSCAN